MYYTFIVVYTHSHRACLLLSLGIAMELDLYFIGQGFFFFRCIIHWYAYSSSLYIYTSVCMIFCFSSRKVNKIQIRNIPSHITCESLQSVVESIIPGCAQKFDEGRLQCLTSSWGLLIGAYLCSILYTYLI